MILKRLNVEVEAHSDTEIEALKKQGFYPITEAPETTAEPKIDVEDLTKKELVNLAEDMGLSVKGLSKAQIIDVITKG